MQVCVSGHAWVSEYEECVCVEMRDSIIIARAAVDIVSEETISAKLIAYRIVQNNFSQC